ncbi:adenylate cyclase [Solibacillus silvestris]|uniref:adenylate cyclase n=1 Tax=Solibacillus silvestris TaxID=76853 RepID=UPI003F7F75D8
MKWIWMLSILFVLYGCTEQVNDKNLYEDDLPTVGIDIPSEVTQHYGSLNIEYKASEIQKEIRSNGVVSLQINEQQLAEIAQETERFFEQYKDVSGLNIDDGIARIKTNETYSDWEITLSNPSLLQQEAFDLAQEFLIKNILTYQLANRHLPELKIQYLSNSGEQLDEKILRTKFAYSDE